MGTARVARVGTARVARVGTARVPGWVSTDPGALCSVSRLGAGRPTQALFKIINNYVTIYHI